jgi:hypothetical protein
MFLPPWFDCCLSFGGGGTAWLTGWRGGGRLLSRQRDTIERQVTLWPASSKSMKKQLAQLEHAHGQVSVARSQSQLMLQQSQM